MYAEALAAAIAAVAVLVAILLFRRGRKQAGRVVFIGQRGTGKTRSFVMLSERESPAARTVPTLEAHSERIGDWLVVDTPGLPIWRNYQGDGKSEDAVASKIISLVDGLGSSDVLVYFFNKKEDFPNMSGLGAKKIFVYTGDAPWPKEGPQGVVELGPIASAKPEAVRALLLAR